MLALSRKEKAFLVDQNHNLLSYSIDEHMLLKRLAPKTSIVGASKQLANVVLAATEDEEHVFYLTPSKYFVFQTDTLGVEMYSFGDAEWSRGTYKGIWWTFSRLLSIRATSCYYQNNHVCASTRSTARVRSLPWRKLLTLHRMSSTLTCSSTELAKCSTSWP